MLYSPPGVSAGPWALLPDLLVVNYSKNKKAQSRLRDWAIIYVPAVPGVNLVPIIIIYKGLKV